MPLGLFANTPICHLFSALVDDAFPGAERCGRATVISGYTEWVSHSAPAIAIGWDWQLGISPLYSLCRRMGRPRSNIMLQRSDLSDVGWRLTAAILGRAIDQRAWQESVLRALNPE